MSRLFEEHQAEQAEKADALLRVPASLAEARAEIDGLKERLIETGSVRAQWPALVIGALLGVAATAVFDPLIKVTSKFFGNLLK